ncbi:hypothetical protein Micbo1qcDRAFT_26936 [Microdochium bolleyi]|uniref:G-protein coupled receptors family 2 profile 2 domain-containing protein n=1 Tax=Microdochium bolleyi TaxID=196109 RepID=A0A136JED5_9PEZI|nr:hypothetical protein Micbo1qcDRAFT_26936 [Microdochium bolleyi]
MNSSQSLHGLCPKPFYQLSKFPEVGGHTEGRLCTTIAAGVTCCLPCPMTDWTYPDSFITMSAVANWITVVSMICCGFLLLSWAFLPVEKTHRHYLSICLTLGICMMNMGFIIPLAAQPDECFNEITPHSMKSSAVCATSGSFLLAGGWAGVIWIFLRALSLHLQICWQVVVGRAYMWFSQALGWGVPIVGLVILLVYSGVSFRFGATCHINHENSLAVFWIPLLVFAGLTVVIQFATFGYCIKVYLASLSDNTASTENSNLPSYSNSIRTMSPRQAYRRVRRVVQLQWRGIVIVLIILADVVFFSIVFVFADNTVQEIKENPQKALPWVTCLLRSGGDKTKCLDLASALAISLPTVIAVLILLGMNGLWLMLLLGRLSMFTAWVELFQSFGGRRKKEFVSADARIENYKEPRSYEMLSRDSGKSEFVLTPLSAAKSPTSPPPGAAHNHEGRRTPDYFGGASRYKNEDVTSFGPTANYQPHTRSFSSPKPPQQVSWDNKPQYYSRSPPEGYEGMNPLGMNRI